MKEIFNNNDPFEDDFFKPSDRVWEGIKTDLPKRKRRWWFLIVIPLLILVLMWEKDGGISSNWTEKSPESEQTSSKSTLASNNGTGDSEKQEDVIQTKENNSINVEATNDQSKKSSFTNNVKNENENNLKVRAADVSFTEKYTDNIRKKIKTPNQRENSNGFNSTVQDAEQLINDSKATNSEIIAQNTIESRARPMYSFGFLEKFTSSLASNSTSEVVKITDRPELISENNGVFLKSNSSKYALAITIGKNFFLEEPKIVGENPLSELITSSAIKNDFVVGVGYQVFQSKGVWSVGLEYGSYSYDVNYDINLEYDLSVEENHGPISTNHFAHSLPTALGSLSTDLVLQRASDSPVAHNENIYLVLNSNVSYNMFRGNFAYDRYVWNGFTLGLGFSPGIIGIVNSESNITSHHDHVKNRSFESLARISETYVLDGDMRLGYMQNFGRLSLQGVLGMRHNLVGRDYGWRFMPRLTIAHRL